MGSLFAPKVPSQPPAPPPPEPVNTRDEISGTETVYIAGPDGKKTAVTRMLPLSPEQQAAKDKLDQLMKDNLARIEVLSGPDFADAIPGLGDTLKAYTDYNTNLVNRGYAKVGKEAADSLAQRGLDDSTTAVQAQVGLGRAKAQDQIAIGQQAKLMENDIRDAEIGRAQNLYGIAAQRGDINFARAVESLGGQRATQGMLMNAAQNYNNTLYSGALQQQQLKYGASQAGLANMAGLIETAGYGIGAAGGFAKLGQKIGWLK